MTFNDNGLTAFGPSSNTTIDGAVQITTHTLRLGGTTTWSNGNMGIVGDGTLQNAGNLAVTGTVGVFISGAGPHRFDNLADGAATVPGSLVVQSEIDNDGTLTVPAGGLLTQQGSVALPGVSDGDFVAQGTGELGLSNVAMSASASASGTGTLRFAGGPSTVAAGADYAAGITELGSSGDLVFNDNGTTGALVATTAAPAAAPAP